MSRSEEKELRRFFVWFDWFVEGGASKPPALRVADEDRTTALKGHGHCNEYHREDFGDKTDTSRKTKQQPSSFLSGGRKRVVVLGKRHSEKAVFFLVRGAHLHLRNPKVCGVCTDANDGDVVMTTLVVDDPILALAPLAALEIRIPSMHVCLTLQLFLSASI